MKPVADYVWRVVLAAVLLTVISFASFRLLRRFQHFPPPDVPYAVMVFWLLVSRFLVAGVLAYPVLRSRWAGTQLIASIFVVYFGAHTFVNLSQVLLIVPDLMSPPAAALLTAHGFLVALMFSVVLVLIMGRMRRLEFIAESSRLHLPAGEWLWKLAVCAAVCVALYLVGRAAVRPYLRTFYDQVGLAPLWQRLMMQTGRALMLVAFVLPVVKMVRGGRVEAALTVASLLCVLAGVAPMLIPGAFQPASVRFTQAVEGGLGNFLYGFLVGYLFSRRPAAA